MTNTPHYFVEPLAFGLMVGVVVWLAGTGGSFVQVIPKFSVLALAAYRILPNMQALYTQLSTISLNQHALEEVVDEFTHVSGKDFET